MSIPIQTNLPAFQARLAKYIELSGKTPDEALAHRTRELTMELFQQFHRIRPDAAGIVESAAARRFTIGREPDRTLAKVHDSGVSIAARNRAEKMLEGAASDYFKVTTSNGVPVVRLARVGVRSAKRLLAGGRGGNRFAASARGLRGLSGEQIERLRDQYPDLRRLNLQALSIAVELGYRARAARGGTMSLQFLHRVFRSRRSSAVKRGPLISRTRGGVGVGEVRFTPGPDGKLVQTNIIGTVPGTAEVDQKRGIVSRAVAAQTADMEKYIARKLAENAKASGLK